MPPAATVTAGQTVTATFPALSVPASLWLFSDPMLMSTADTGATQVRFAIPANTKAGVPTLVLAAVDGTVISSTPVTVTTAPANTTGNLANTGTLIWPTVAIVLLLLLGGLALSAARRRARLL